jgi:para-aminobenzoate synthetase/4-amino-4-deoxychorismate lyase
VFDHATGEFEGAAPAQLANVHSESPARDQTGEAPAIDFGVTEQEYSSRIDDIHEWIRAGDVYQLNFTFPLRFRVGETLAALYARLSHRQAVPYGALLHWQAGRHILSFSPELFFRIEPHGTLRRIVTQPMKGTAPRGRTNAEDVKIAEWLRNDPKNRSENVMIVDLLRNDLGRLCEYGSVQVTELFAAERFQTLWQLTSTISGELRQGVGYEDILRALFPCGSVTGAPKVHAMQLLAQLEPETRGVYTGAIGYFSRNESIFNVAIRTIELDGGQGKMGVGSGIVIDSDAAEEFRECKLKAEFLTAKEERFSLIESLLWEGHYPFLELHLDRLVDSAKYFDLVCDREATRSALQAHAAKFAGLSPHKVRVLLNRDGSLDIGHELLPVEDAANLPTRRVCIAAHRTDPRDRMLFHKTTHRPRYIAALAAAQAAGFDDALFLNLEGQVTESAIGNVFIERGKQLLTPPVECGLLAGVYRRHLLEMRLDIEEQILYPDDVKTADAVYLSNAVRGLRRVIIDWAQEPV